MNHDSSSDQNAVTHRTMSWLGSFWGGSSAKTPGKPKDPVKTNEDLEGRSNEDIAKDLIKCIIKKDKQKLKQALKSIDEQKLPVILIETAVIHAYRKNINNSPLSYACETSTRDICEVLFEFIKNENDEWFTRFDVCHMTAIHFAAINPKAEILDLLYEKYKALMEKNIDKESKTNRTTPLQFACKYNSEECVKWLLNKGADFKKSNKDGILPIHYAADGGNTDIFTLIFEKHKEEDKVKRMVTIGDITKSARKKQDVEADVPLVEVLDEDEANQMVEDQLANERKKLGEDALLIEDNNCEIPLLYAARELNLECIEKILGYQELADATIRNNDCNTALHFICNNMTTDILLDKVTKNEMLNKKLEAEKELHPLHDYEKDTELKNKVEEEVCQDYYTKYLAIILKANALLGVKNESGNKPLDWLSLETVKMLLDRHIHKRMLPEKKVDTSKKDKYEIVLTNFFGHHASGSDMKNILALANSKKHEDLALHPLCQSIVSVKWQKMEKYFLLKALFFIPLVIILTIYSVLLEAKLSTTGNSTDTIMKNDEQLNNIWIAAYSLLMIQVIFGLLSVFVLIGPFINESRAYTAKTGTRNFMRLMEFYGNELLWSDWPEYLLWICSFLLLHDCISPIFVVIIAWFSLFLVCSKHPCILPFRYIFVKILYRYIRFFIFAFGLITGFGMGFYFLLSTCKSQDGKEPCAGGAFEQVTLMALKIPSMMMGEITYDEFPLDHAYPWVYILFGAFIFLITCCLFNMMNGLAVNITEELMQKSEIFKTIAECEMIFEFEVLLKEVSSWLVWLGIGEIPFLSPIWFDEIVVSPSLGTCLENLEGYKLKRSIVNEAKILGEVTETLYENDSDSEDNGDSNGEAPLLIVTDASHLAVNFGNNLDASSRQSSIGSLQDAVASEPNAHP